MKLFQKMYKLREVQSSHNRPDNPSAASQPRGQTPHGRAREVRCVTRRRPAALSGTTRAYTLRPAARGSRTADAVVTPPRNRIRPSHIEARRLVSPAGRPSLHVRQTTPRSFDIDAACWYRVFSFLRSRSLSSR